MSTQVVIGLPDEVFEAVNHLIESGVFPSLEAAILTGLDGVIGSQSGLLVDEAIQAGYIVTPPSPAESTALASLREAILEEPW